MACYHIAGVTCSECRNLTFWPVTYPPPQVGWICGKCGTSNAPWMATCFGCRMTVPPITITTEIKGGNGDPV